MSLPRLTFLITDLHLGGTPLVLRDLAFGLRGFEISVISLKPLPTRQGEPTIADQLRGAGIVVHSLELESFRDFPAALVRLVRLLNEFRPRVLYSLLVHANAVAAAAMPFLVPRPVFIQSIHTLQERPRWHWVLQGVLSRFADGVIVPARPILDRMGRYGCFERGVVIPNGVDADRFADAAGFPAAELPWPVGSRVIGYVGRFDPVKDLPVLVEAFAMLCGAEGEGGGGRGRDVHLALVGYGGQEGELRRLATWLHIAPRVHFAGPTRTPEKWYKVFSVMCLPSSVEGFGLTLVEAMAAGVPVVAVRTAVTEGIVRDGVDGRLVTWPVTAGALAEALQQVMARWPLAPQGRTEAVEGSVDRVRAHFSVGRMVASHGEFFQILCTTRG